LAAILERAFLVCGVFGLEETSVSWTAAACAGAAVQLTVLCNDSSADIAATLLGVASDVTAVTPVTVTAAADTSADSLGFLSGFCGVFCRLIT